MAAFIPNYSASGSIAEQWRNHLQTQEYVNDVTSAVERSVEEYNQRAEQLNVAIQQSSVEISESVYDAAAAQIEAARQRAAEIVGAIDRSADLISGSIDSIGQILDYRITLLIDQQRVGNLLLHNIAELLRIPDFQKERLHYIQQGFKHYQNAKIDRSLMRDALTNLLKAEERENSDYVVLHRIGLIYLNSSLQEINSPATAEEYFLRAGRYASVESEPAAARVAFLLAEGSDLSSRYSDIPQVRNLAADAFLQAGRACYLQRKVLDAIAHARRATELSPDYSLAWFQRAKFLAAADRTKDAVPMLERVIKEERLYATSAADDPDLAPKVEVRALLEHLRDESRAELKAEIEDIERLKPSFLNNGGDHYSEYAQVKENFRDGRYLSARRGLDAIKNIMESVETWRQTAQSLSHFRSKVLPGRTILAGAVVEHEQRLSSATSFGSVLSVRKLLCKPQDDKLDVEGYLETLSGALKDIASAKVEMAEVERLIPALKQNSARLERVVLKELSIDNRELYTTGFTAAERADPVIENARTELSHTESKLDNLSYDDCLAARQTISKWLETLRQVKHELRCTLSAVETEAVRLEQNEAEQNQRFVYICIFFAFLLLIFVFILWGSSRP